MLIPQDSIGNGEPSWLSPVIRAPVSIDRYGGANVVCEGSRGHSPFRTNLTRTRLQANGLSGEVDANHMQLLGHRTARDSMQMVDTRGDFSPCICGVR